MTTFTEIIVSDSPEFTTDSDGYMLVPGADSEILSNMMRRNVECVENCPNFTGDQESVERVMDCLGPTVCSYQLDCGALNGNTVENARLVAGKLVLDK